MTISDFDTGRVKTYNLDDFGSREEFLEQYESDGMGDGEIVDSGIFGDITFPIPECWEFMDLEEADQELVLKILDKADNLEEAISKVVNGEVSVYSYDYKGHLDPSEIVGYSLLDELGIEDLVSLAVDTYNLDDQIAKLVGKAILDNTRLVVEDEELDNVIYTMQ